MARPSFLENRYYTINSLGELFGAQRHQIEAAILYVKFPAPSMKIGQRRYWEKEVADPYLPAMRDYIGGDVFLRNKDELIADIRAWIREQDLSKQDVQRLRDEYLRWTSKGYKGRRMMHYGSWISLVLNAMKEPT